MANFFWLFLSLLLLINSADYSIRYASRLAKGLRLSKYAVGFTIVAAISILPEMSVSISSALQGIPSFGLGALYGSNVADLTLVFAIVVLTTGRSLKIESQFLKNRLYYIAILSVPLLLGLNGHYSRFEGLILIAVGGLFYYFILKKCQKTRGLEQPKNKPEEIIKNSIFLLLSLILLLAGAYFTVKFAVNLAYFLSISPILIALIIGLGTCLPELSFSIKAAKNNHENLALGDILGTVISDATILVGILALINPFAFDQKIIFVTGLFMLFALVLLLYFMKTGKVLTKAEGLLLLLFYLLFVLTQFMVGGVY